MQKQIEPKSGASQPDAQEQANREQVNRLGTSKISKLMLEFAIPAIIGLVVNGLYNIVDSIFMGHGVGAVGLATATVAGPIMIFSMAVSVLIGAGGNALAALRLGEGRLDEAERVLGNAFSLTVVFSVLCSAVVLIFMDPVLRLSGATEGVWESSHTFISILAWAFILQFFGMGFNNFMRTAGDPARATWTMVVGTVICIVLNFLFVMVFKWGIAGSAWATVIGQGVSAALVFWYFVFSKKAPFKLRLRYLRIKPRLVGSICALGSASFVMQIANAVVNLVLNHQLIFYGDMTAITGDGALASIGVVQRITMFAFFPLLGVAMAASPIFGYNYGAKNYRRVKTTFKVALIWVMAIGVFFWLLIHIFPNQIVSFFGVREDLLEFTVRALQIMVFMLPLVGLQVIASNYFQSSGQPLKSMFLSLTRQLLYLIPLLYLLPLLSGPWTPWPDPLDALCYTYPISDVLSIFTAAAFMFAESRKLNRRIRQQSAQE